MEQLGSFKRELVDLILADSFGVGLVGKVDCLGVEIVAGCSMLEVVADNIE